MFATIAVRSNLYSFNVCSKSLADNVEAVSTVIRGFGPKKDSTAIVFEATVSAKEHTSIGISAWFSSSTGSLSESC